MCVCGLCLSQKTVQKVFLIFFLQTTAFQTIITKNLSFSKSRFSFCFLLNLKTNKIIKFGPKPELPRSSS